MPAWLQWLLACSGSFYAGAMLMGLVVSAGRSLRRGGYVLPPASNGTSPVTLTHARTPATEATGRSDGRNGARSEASVTRQTAHTPSSVTAPGGSTSDTAGDRGRLAASADSDLSAVLRAAHGDKAWLRPALQREAELEADRAPCVGCGDDE